MPRATTGTTSSASRSIADGVIGHWIDLGEPEMYDPNDWTAGVLPGKHGHADYHNLYNLKWAEGIARGYARNAVDRRPFMMARSGAGGIQRFGAGLWSGDIGSNLDNLDAHLNAQMHMSLSGVDYFGADIGGFHRGATGGRQPRRDVHPVVRQRRDARRAGASPYREPLQLQGDRARSDREQGEQSGQHPRALRTEPVSLLAGHRAYLRGRAGDAAPRLLLPERSECAPEWATRNCSAATCWWRR